MRRARSTRGQASIEWIAVVGVVAATLVVAGAASGAPQIAGVVVRQFDRALCIVARGDCDEDRTPCVTRSGTDMEDSSINLGLIKVSSTTTELVDHRSDGTWHVTVTHDEGGGLEGGFGGDFSFSGLGLKLAIGGEARASVLAHSGKGETWLAHGEAEAQYVGALARFGQHLPGRQPEQRFSQHGTLTGLGGSVSVPEGTLDAGFTRDDIDGTRTDTATGNITTYLRSRLDPDASLRFGQTLAAVSLGGMKSTDYALTTDAAGRPIDFEIFSVGRLAAGVGLTGPLKVASGKLNHKLGTAWEYEQHLDLTDPDNRAAATAYMADVKDPRDHLGDLPVSLRALAVRLALDGTEHARFYDLKQNSGGISAHLSGGLKVGGSYSEQSINLRLVGAQVRGPDGIWTDRDDCVKAA